MEELLKSVMTLFGDYTLYIYGAVAILFFWKTSDGKRLYESLLEKLDKKTPTKDEPKMLSAIQEISIPEVEPIKPIKAVEPVEMPKVSDGVRAVGITLVNQDLAELTIKNKNSV